MWFVKYTFFFPPIVLRRMFLKRMDFASILNTQDLISQELSQNSEANISTSYSTTSGWNLKSNVPFPFGWTLDIYTTRRKLKKKKEKVSNLYVGHSKSNDSCLFPQKLQQIQRAQ